MARLISAFKQFLDGNGDPIPGGKLLFRENRISTKKDTFSDVDLNNLNSNPVTLDGEGYSPPVFGQGIYSIDLFLSDGETFVIGFDDVSPEGGTGSGAFENWSSSVNYEVPAYVTGSDSKIYKAIANSKGVDPVTDNGSIWIKIEFVTFWSGFVSYDLNQKVKGSDNKTYTSLKNSNINNDPVGNGGVEWQLDEALQDWVTGRTYIIGEKVISTVDNRIYKAVTSQAGNEPNADSGTNWLPVEGVVDKPVNVSPVDTATDVSRTPTLTASAFSISGSSNVHEWSIWQIADSVGFTNIIYESDITDDLVSHTVKTPLERATTFYRRVAYKGIRTDVSEFSDITSFTTVPDLSEIFAINSDTGSGALRTAITGIDLLTGSGSIWTKNRDTTDFVKRLDTSRNLNELDLAEESAQAANANGLQQYFSNGFEIGTDIGYNGLNDIISSYVFKNFPGFHDTVQYVGNSTDRDIAHSIGTTVAGYMIKNMDTLIASQSGYVFKEQNMPSNQVFQMDGVSTSSALGGATSTTFNVNTSIKVNNTGDTYICELFADNPSIGITGGTYLGTGNAGLKIVAGFPGGLLISVAAGSGAVGTKGTHIADIKSGTGSHILADLLGNIVVPGSVASFDSDGVTLDSNTLNTSGVTYHYIIVADPLQF